MVGWLVGCGGWLWWLVVMIDVVVGRCGCLWMFSVLVSGCDDCLGVCSTAELACWRTTVAIAFCGCCLFPSLFDGRVSLRIFPAETRLTVYRRCLIE